MWNIMKILFKLYASLSITNGIIYGLSDPKKNAGSLLLVGFLGWVLWKMWKKKEQIVPAVVQDRYKMVKMQF